MRNNLRDRPLPFPSIYSMYDWDLLVLSSPDIKSKVRLKKDFESGYSDRIRIQPFSKSGSATLSLIYMCNCPQSRGFKRPSPPPTKCEPWYSYKMVAQNMTYAVKYVFSDLTTLSMKPNAFNKLKYLVYSICAHRFLSYHLI